MSTNKFVSFFVNADGSIDDVNGCSNVLSNEERNNLIDHVRQTLDPTPQEVARFEKSGFANRLRALNLPVVPFKPHDIYFHVGLAWRHYDENYNPLEEPVRDEVLVVVCPRFYFDAHGYVTDCCIQSYIKQYLPKRMAEQTDCQFWTSRWTVDNLRAELKRRGFVESEKFSAFSETHDPFLS